MSKRYFQWCPECEATTEHLRMDSDFKWVATPAPVYVCKPCRREYEENLNVEHRNTR